jgi:3-isopropylmalate/(R)-2-methylmalate dehydratase large subunit
VPTLLKKVWNAHTVRKLPNGQTQIFIGLHLIPEVTSRAGVRHAQGARLDGSPPRPHLGDGGSIVPTRDQRRPFLDVLAEDMLAALERNCREAGVRLIDLTSGSQGIVHVIGPEQG